MPQTVKLCGALSEENLSLIQERVAIGEYASAEDGITDSIPFLVEQEEERRRWEDEVLIPIHDHLMANPSTAIPIDQVERNLEARRLQRRKAS